VNEEDRAAADSTRSALLTALTTEHFILQTAANATVADAAARSSLYVFSLSSSLVALGFISQSPRLLTPFLATVLPAVFLLGILTVVRLVDSALENMQYLAGIARIRSYYRALTPDAETYFSARTGRWPEGPSPSLGLGPFIAFLGTTASMIAFIDSVVAGAGVALLVDAFVGGNPVGLGLVCGVFSVAACMVAFLVFQRWRFTTIDEPTPESSATSVADRKGDT
jgi:hypothetical protein